MVIEISNFYFAFRILLSTLSVFFNTAADILMVLFYKIHVYVKSKYFSIEFEDFESFFIIFVRVFSKGLLFLIPFLIVDYKRVEKLVIHHFNSASFLLFLNHYYRIKNNILKLVFQLIKIKLWLSKFVIYYRLLGFSKLNILLNGTLFLNKLGFLGF
jgi:hypothetical protein